METNTNGSRAQFLRRGAQGGLALMAGGAVLALAACGDDDDTPAAGGDAATNGGDTSTTGGGPEPMGDAAIATLAATAELLAIDFYSMAIDSGMLMDENVVSYMEAARQNEQDHYDALAMVIGEGAPADLTFTYPEGTFDSVESIAETGSALETAFVGAYMGAVTALMDQDLKQVAGQIGANEAQHLTNFNAIGAGALVPNPSLPEVLTAQEATDALTPFLA